ncbi:heparin lyase I family protein [Candidatus Nomurabacteria bacterium]|nr:heparin lyase I family protein [Candidatus Nomurabacteria bacterium]
MFSRTTNIFLYLAILFLGFTISLFYTQPALAQSSSGQRNEANIIYFSGGETGKINFNGRGEDAWGKELFKVATNVEDPAKAAESVKVVSNVARAGSKSIRIFYDKNWGTWPTSGKWRSELKAPSKIYLENGKEYWIGFSIYLEDNANNRDLIKANRPNAHTIQWHSMITDGTSGINMYEGYWNISFGKSREYKLKPIELGKWTDFVLHVKVSDGSDGFWKVWINGQPDSTPDHQETGATVLKGDQLNQKMGIYRSTANWYGNSSYAEQYYDEFRIGNEKASFVDVMPGNGSSASVGNVSNTNNTTNTSPSGPPSVDLKVSPTRVGVGQTATLTWTSRNTEVCVGGGFSTGGKTSGKVTVRVTNSTTFVVACAGGGVSKYDTARVSIDSTKTVSNTSTRSGTLTVNLTASPSTVGVGQATELSWNAKNASVCVGGGFSTRGGTSGSVTIPVFTPTTYAIACAGGGKNVTDTVRVKVDGSSSSKTTNTTTKSISDSATKTTAPISSGSAKIIFTGDFETGAIQNAASDHDGWGKQLNNNPSKVTTEQVRAGKYAWKTDFSRITSYYGTNKPRAELLKTKPEMMKLDTEYWFGLSVYIPSDWVADSNPEILWQIHGSGNFSQTSSPPLAFGVSNNNMHMVHRYDINGKMTTKNFWIAPIEKGKWMDFIVNVNWTGKDNGFIKVWKDGKVIYDRKGTTGYNYDGTGGAYLKIGDYKWWWFTQPTSVYRRVLYHDEIRIAEGSDGYNLVNPASY